MLAWLGFQISLKNQNFFKLHKTSASGSAYSKLKGQNDQCLNYFDELFCPVGENGVITRSSNKQLKLPFRKTKLGIKSLSYEEPNTWNSLTNNLKSATSVNFFKHYIKE